jgi:hypothetical protein
MLAPHELWKSPEASFSISGGTVAYQSRAIHQASRILEKIDERWPAQAKT